MKYHVFSCEMNFLIYYEVFLLLLLIQGIRAEGDEGCFIGDRDLNENDDRTVIDDTDRLKKNEFDKIVYEGSCKGISAVEVTSTLNVYFKVYLTDADTNERIVVKSTSELKKIDEYYHHIASETKEIGTDVTITCSNGKKKSVTFKVNIDDVNIHPPEFSQTEYQFTLPMPMPYSIDLKQFGDKEISVTDKDFSNTDIICTSSLEQLVCSSEYKEKTNSYILHMSFNTYVNFVETMSFELTATDNGVPPLESKAKITFEINEDSNFYVASFSQPSFFYEYQEETGTIAAENEPVTIANPIDNIECEISEEFRQYFQQPVLKEGTVIVQLQGKLPDSILSENTLRVTLNCGIPKKNQGYADVLISIPPKKPVLFSKYSYTAKYLIDGDVHKVEMTDFISTEESTKTITIDVDEEYSKYFEVKLSTKGNNQWLLSKKEDLTPDILENSNLNIIISIDFPSITFRDKAAVMVVLPNGDKGVYFVTSNMIGDYVLNEDGNGALTNDIAFELNSKYVHVLKSELVGQYGEYFKINNKKPNIFAIETNGNLPDEALQLDTIVLTLLVEFSLGVASQSTEATFILRLPSHVISTNPPPSTPTTVTSTDPPRTTLSPVTPTDPTPTPDCDYIVWLVVTIILCLILILYIGATILYYFKKIRNRNSDLEYLEFPVQEEKMEDHYQKKMSRNTPLKDVSTRRPTGFIRFNPDLENEDDADSINSETEKNTSINKQVNPPPPPPPPKDDAKDEKTAEFQETLADAIKKAVKERESRLI